MKILILGGNRFIGRELVATFARAGHEVSIFNRSGNTSPDLPSHQVIRGDRHHPEDLKRAAQAGVWDIVIDNNAYQKEDVVQAIGTLKPKKRYFYTSTVSVYKYSPKAYRFPLTENSVEYSHRPKPEDSTNPHWIYARGKMEAEAAVVTQNEVPWTVIRPAAVYGEDDANRRGFWYLSRMLDGGPLLLADSGEHSFRLAYVKDVAQLYLQAAEKEAARNRIYNVAQNEIITLRNFLDESAKALDVTPHYVNIPFEFLGESLAGPLATMPNFIPDISRAKNDLGFHPTPFENWCGPVGIWFRDHGRADAASLLTTRAKELELASRWARFSASVRS